MTRHPFRSTTSIRGILDHWPLPREPQARPYPHGTPRHDRLLAFLDPIRCTLTSRDHDLLTWAQIAPLAKG